MTVVDDTRRRLLLAGLVAKLERLPEGHIISLDRFIEKMVEEYEQRRRPRKTRKTNIGKSVIDVDCDDRKGA